MPYKQKRNPIPLTGCGRRRPEEMTNPFRKATRKVCLPYNKIKSMSNDEKKKVINAKKSAANKGKQVRDSKSWIRDGSTRSDGLKDWVNQDWRQVANPGKKCGEK